MRKTPKMRKTPTEAVVEAPLTQSRLLRSKRKHLLSGGWEQKTPTFEKAEGVLTDVSPVPSFEELSEFVSSNPDVARWMKEKEQRSAALELEKVRRILDVTLGGGVQQFRDNNENALIFGVSIPIPLSDRNQGNVLAAWYKWGAGRKRSAAQHAFSKQLFMSLWDTLKP